MNHDWFWDELFWFQLCNMSNFHLFVLLTITPQTLSSILLIAVKTLHPPFHPLKWNIPQPHPPHILFVSVQSCFSGRSLNVHLVLSLWRLKISASVFSCCLAADLATSLLYVRVSGLAKPPLQGFSKLGRLGSKAGCHCWMKATLAVQACLCSELTYHHRLTHSYWHALAFT